MNINIDNYEAYLLDYQDGNLSAEETAQLRAFVEAQGMDWAELTSELPQLVAPEVVFEDKDALKHKAKVIPLFVKIASAAAAAALLFVLIRKPGMGSLEPVETAALKPVVAGQIALEKPIQMKMSLAEFKASTPKTPVKPKPQAPVAPATPNTPKKTIVSPQPREAVPLLAVLKPIAITCIPMAETQVELAFTPRPVYDEIPLYAYAEDEFDDMSIVARGFQKMTGGKYDSFADMLGEGLQMAKTELAMVKEQTISLPLQKIREYDIELHHVER